MQTILSINAFNIRSLVNCFCDDLPVIIGRRFYCTRRWYWFSWRSVALESKDCFNIRVFHLSATTSFCWRAAKRHIVCTFIEWRHLLSSVRPSVCDGACFSVSSYWRMILSFDLSAAPKRVIAWLLSQLPRLRTTSCRTGRRAELAVVFKLLLASPPISGT